MSNMNNHSEELPKSDEKYNIVIDKSFIITAIVGLIIIFGAMIGVFYIADVF